MKPVIVNNRTKTKISKLSDGATFCLSKRKTAVLYVLHTKKKGIAVFGSTQSSKTYTRPAGTECWY